MRGFSQQDNYNGEDEWGHEMEMLLFSGGEDNSNSDTVRLPNGRKIITVPPEWLDGTVPLPTDAQFARWVQQQLAGNSSSSSSVMSLSRSSSSGSIASTERQRQQSGNVLDQVVGGAAAVLAKASIRKRNIRNPYQRGDSFEMTSLA